MDLSESIVIAGVLLYNIFATKLPKRWWLAFVGFLEGYAFIFNGILVCFSLGLVLNSGGLNNSG